MKTIWTMKNEAILVDDEDYARVSVFMWHVSDRGYVRTGVREGGKTKKYAMHRLILGAKPGEFVDHRDRNKQNNTRGNLRLCTTSENQANSALRSHSSRFRGVSRRRAGRWAVTIRVQGAGRHLGTFTDEEEAARVYDAAAQAEFGEFATLNFPQQSLCL